MIRNPRIASLAAFALAATIGTVRAADVEVADTKNLVDDGIVRTTLADVLAHPRAYLKTRFVFEGRYDTHGAVYQPFFTPFEEQTHTNFSAWPAETLLSDRDAYQGVFPLLYMDRRRGAMMERLFSLAKFQRFRAVGVVEAIFAGRPFVDVLFIEPLDRDFTPRQHLLAAFGRTSHPAHERAAASERDLPEPHASQDPGTAPAAAAAEPRAPSPESASSSSPREEPAPGEEKAGDG